jgi:hypothetical protein
MAADALKPVDDPEEAVDLDLDAQDEELRAEAVGDPTVIRVKGMVVHISHAADWDSAAMRAAVTADWDAWAALVIPDDTEREHWQAQNIRNYQVEAVFEKCAARAKLNAGKSPRQSGSSRRTRRR